MVQVMRGLNATDANRAAARGAVHYFGDYELLEEIARGGMGVVFKARQVSLNRTVALKMILAGKLASPALVLRFHTEAESAANLKHPHIVAIHEVGEHEGQHYFSMDYIAGQSLAERVRQGPMPLPQAARCVQTIAGAIHYAHQRGVLHRDLKPSNILLDAQGQPHVTDFGLAKLVEQESSLTQSEAILGTPSYMAPEQAAGEAKQLTIAADIYSLGAILYELLAGQPPFRASTALETMRRVVEQEPVPPWVARRSRCKQGNPKSEGRNPKETRNPKSESAANPGSLRDSDFGLRSEFGFRPSDLDIICLKCLRKDPAARYASADALAEDLARWQDGEPIQARPVGQAEKLWRWCRRKPALASFGTATSFLLLAVGVGLPIATYRINHERQRAERGELDARQKAYASDMNLAQQAVQEDDFYRALQLLDRHRPETGGVAAPRRPAGAARHPYQETDLRGWEWRYLWRQCQGEERFILGEHTNGATAVGLLADGKTVFSAGRDRLVCLWDLESRRQIALLPHPEEIVGAAASPDGLWLATATRKDAEGQAVRLWDLATQKIADTLTTNFNLHAGSITFSPDNKWLAFATVFGGIRVWDVNARTEVTNLKAFRTSRAPIGLAFSPDSRTLAYNENDYGAILLWDIASRSEIGRLTGHQSAVTALAFSRDGQTLASGSQDRTARLWNVAERREGFAFTNHSGGFTTLAFSPNGRTLALGGAGGAGRVIRLVDVETKSQKAQRQGHRNDISSLAFTRDGQTLLSASDDGTIRVWDLVPSAKEKSVREFARNSISTDWSSYGPALCLSPDGRHLLAVYTNQTFSVWGTLGLAEGERHPLPFTNTTAAAVAPGGTLAAFASRRGELMLWNAETGQARFFAQPDTNSIHRLVFSLDGRYLAAGDDTKTLSETTATLHDPRRTVRVWDVGARKETHVFSTEGEFPVSLSFSGDSKALLAGFWKGSIRLWPLDEPGGVVTIHGQSWWVNGLALLPDGQTLLAAETDSRETETAIRFWDVRTRHENALKLSARAGAYDCLALSPDGHRFAAGADDGRITIWDVASHQEVATLAGHQESVMQLTFTPDGDHLVSVSKDQLRVWRAPTLAQIDAAEKEGGNERR
jgi:WD40 repeat protein/serine/threonine protein kinase